MVSAKDSWAESLPLVPPGQEQLSEFHSALKGELAGCTPDFEVSIPMRDGVLLAGDVYLPPDRAYATPAIVQITPYGKSWAPWSREARWFADRGYATVVVDIRGCGGSGGEFHWFVHDGADGHDVVEWVAEQAWCDGAVGTTGISYMGWVQWALAAERPPHLKCMISSAPAGRWMQEIPYTWGIFQNYFLGWLYGIQQQAERRAVKQAADWPSLLSTWPVADIGEALGLSGPSWSDALTHWSLDQFWQALRFDQKYSEIDVPCLHVAGWYDIENLLGAMHHYEQMIRDSPAATDQTLLVGPWSHGGVRYPHSSYDGIDFGPSSAVDMNEVHLRWFDKWLRGVEARWTLAPTAIFDTGRRMWTDDEQWLEAPAAHEFYLTPHENTYAGSADNGGGALSEKPATSGGQAAYLFDPSAPTGPRFDFREYPATDYPIDETAVEQRDDVLTWTSEALDTPLTLTGWSRLIVHASTDGTDTDWHVKITDVDSYGRSLRVSSGCLRASCRNGLETPEPVQPDIPVEYAIEPGPAHHSFLPGHRLRVSLASSDFPWFTRSSNRFDHPLTAADPRACLNTVFFGGPYPSRLVLGTTPLPP